MIMISIKKLLALPLLAISLIIISFSAHTKTFKMALGDTPGGTQYELGSKFAELLQEKTGGKHRVNLFPNSQLGSEQNTVNDAAIGLLDFSVIAINNLTPFSPTVGILTLPYVIQSLDDAVKLTHGEISNELTQNTLRDARVRIIGWTYSGFRVLTNSKRPIDSLSDLKGLVIRVPKNEIMISTYQAWGINPTPMAWSETFTGLQQKVIDGQDNPYITIHAMKFYEVQQYITNIRYIFSLEPLIVSESVFQSQKPEVQKAIIEAGKGATLHSLKYLTITEAQIKRNLQNKGMQISEPLNEEEWINIATKAVWPKYYKSIGGQQKLDRVLQILGR